MRLRLIFGALCLLVCLVPFACNQSSLVPIDVSPDGTGDSTTDGPSVGDVTVGGGGEPGSPLPGGVVRARVRNESRARADVTVRFIRDDTVVHLAFVRVLTSTVTTVASPEMADVVELSGQDQHGRALGDERLLFGADFDESRPAEYTIRDPSGQPLPDPDDGLLPTITLLEPQSDLSLVLGSTFVARWQDESGEAGSVVRISLRAVETASSPVLIPIGPAVGVALDGLNDQLVAVLEGAAPGLYEVIAEIDDGRNVVQSVAPGRIEVILDLSNTAPSLSIVSPTSAIELHNGDFLAIVWTDDDPDDNATITFSLVASESADIALGTFGISPPLAEDADGPAFDGAALPIVGVLPGLYDLVGTIDDGQLQGTARVRALVRILPDVRNDTPTLVLTAPASDLSVPLTGAFVVRWTDSDENDNARISLLLDPDLAATGLDGDEILLVESLGEDADGAGDQVTLGVPAAAAAGEYRVVGTITDGLSQLVTRAPGRLIVFSSGQSGGNPPALPRLALPHPSGPVRTRVGELIPLRIETTNVAGSADIRVRLRSMGEGAAMLDVDVTPAELTLNADTELRVPDAPGIIPNDWWPRSFELSVEVTVNGTQFSAQAPGIVWIRQEVEVRHVTMVNYWCFDAGNAVPVDTPFTGLEIEWFGGGFGPQAGVAPGRVAFWLFNDPIFPGDGVQDARHRIVHEATERANHTRVTRIDYDSLIGRVAELEPSVQAALDSGEYKITTVVNAEIFGQIIAPPHPAPVEVCFPLPFDDASP